MTNKLEQAARLKEVEDYLRDCANSPVMAAKVAALREALAEQAEQERMPITEPVVPWLSHKVAEQAEPVAWLYEYGTDRGDAVNEIRWYPNVSLTKPTCLAKNIRPLYTAPQPVQEPVAKVVMNRANQITMQKPNGDYFDISKHVGEYFYTVPVRTKDLTDEEEHELAKSSVGKSRHWLVAAAIAAYKEKNK